jgi:ubiquinone/menaquinone biosynthesis C-methylase UbiE
MVMGPLPRLEGVGELIDQPGIAPEELVANLRDLERVNRWFGGTRLILRTLASMLRRVPAGEVRILDVATGGADIPVAVVRWARRQGRRIRIVGVDGNPQVLRASAARIRDYPEIRLETADALALPYPPGSFDVVLCSLALHHFTYPQGVALLRALDRIGRWGFIVNDLLRSRHAYLLTWLAMRLCCGSRLACHDGPLSIRRAYTRAELRAMVEEARVDGVHLHAHPFFRVALVKEHPHDRAPTGSCRPLPAVSLSWPSPRVRGRPRASGGPFLDSPDSLCYVRPRAGVAQWQSS